MTNDRGFMTDTEFAEWKREFLLLNDNPSSTREDRIHFLFTRGPEIITTKQAEELRTLIYGEEIL